MVCSVQFKVCSVLSEVSSSVQCMKFVVDSLQYAVYSKNVHFSLTMGSVPVQFYHWIVLYLPAAAEQIVS